MIKQQIKLLEAVHKDLTACRQCPKMIGPVVHGPALTTKIMLIGQAPGPHEGKFGRPFAWTAGKTLFRWFEEAMGIDENQFRESIYMAAIARCFPGKSSGGGDRKPDPIEIAACGDFLKREVEILEPQLIIPVGTLAIEQVMKIKLPLVELIGRSFEIKYHGLTVDAIPLPHPSGASSWPKVEPGRSLLKKALCLLASHPAMASVMVTKSY